MSEAVQFLDSSCSQGTEEFPWKNKALALDHWLRNADPPGFRLTLSHDIATSLSLSHLNTHIHIQMYLNIIHQSLHFIMSLL